MNREIKFRKWAKHTNGEYGMVDWMILSGGTVYQLLDLEDGEVLMQYTNLKDKNGVEIYEGDIVQFEEPEFESGVLQCEMVFFDGVFCAKWPNGYIPVWDFIKDVEVIGNIYENKELTKD